MGQTIVQYSGFICDKCGHKWITKKERAIENRKDSKKIQEEFDNNPIKPKICPKCKTKKWNYLGVSITNSMTKELLKLYKKQYGKEVADFIKESHDLKFRKKRLVKEIEKIKKDLSNPQLKNDKKFIENGKKLIKEFEEMLKDLEKMK
ncbi:hypothetical protein A3K82_02610 [Candidatus Pacearchaeota archaeon RBG_19FT_COMBO_34_9]|nr:MAG: hypothetical protein A3K82_02610 [Candidatus Pacearchaeota archaeon RBG_19FT_COMBO_34_9]OGJ15940.1 MAG: hypothetical protein A3K74_02480 [Candidatus Pacearchaeota archaeon RBG_13_33_26]